MKGTTAERFLERARNLHGSVLAIALALCLVGVASIDLAIFTDAGTWVGTYAGRQVLFAVAALGVMAAVLVPHYRTFERLALPLFAGAVGLLLLTAIVGVQKNNARRWIDLGPVLLQSSEPMKIALVLALARLLRRPRGRRLPTFLAAAGVTLLAVALVVRQPDLGTALLYVPVLLVLLFLSGYSWKLFVTLALVAAAALPIGIRFGLKDYQRARIVGFLRPGASDPAGDGYQRVRSLTAIGAGGSLGIRGEDQLLCTLSGVPERHTDFIFTVVGARWGFGGAGLVVLGYLLLVLLLFRIALRTRDPFGRLVAGGVATLFAVQALVNLGMTAGVAPITGLTLPLMSYGGSSLLTSFAALGLALNVSARPARTLARGDFS